MSDFQDFNGYLVPSSCQKERLGLARLNGHERDSEIAFDPEPHKYYVKGQTTKFLSATGIVHAYFEEFESREVCQKMIKREDFKTKKYEKYHKMIGATEEETIRNIMKSWEENGKEQAMKGTAMHRWIELYLNQEKVLDAEGKEMKDESVEFQYFLNWLKEKGDQDLEPFRCEWQLWDLEYSAVGTIDAIFRNKKTGEYIMFDWKRSKQISKSSFGGKKGLGVCRFLLDCNYTHYTLQLNLYKFLLEKNYGLNISRMFIVVFHPDNEDFLEFEIFPKQSVIKTILEQRATLSSSS